MHAYLHTCVNTCVHVFLFWGEVAIAYIRFSVSCDSQKRLRTHETAWQAKALAAQPGDLSSIHGIWCGREPAPELVL